VAYRPNTGFANIESLEQDKLQTALCRMFSSQRSHRQSTAAAAATVFYFYSNFN